MSKPEAAYDSSDIVSDEQFSLDEASRVGEPGLDALPRNEKVYEYFESIDGVTPEWSVEYLRKVQGAIGRRSFSIGPSQDIDEEVHVHTSLKRTVEELIEELERADSGA